MKIAVLSDIHSNSFALSAVVDQLAQEKPDHVILLGDTFGYYPWAVETFALVRDLNPIALLGNHDELVLRKIAPEPPPVYWEMAQQNAMALAEHCPSAISWLRELQPCREVRLADVTISACHGTPADPLNGRYYPDDRTIHDWFPDKAKVLLMGHTHYPLVRGGRSHGLVVNPGSVGQPRDGDVRASWGLLDLEQRKFELRRTPYSVSTAVGLLSQMGWSKLAIAALQKSHPGSLRIEQ